jgi:predicted NBD/HSP70 family sugar kinase
MYLLFDIGGTKARFAISNNGTSFDEPLVIDTPKNYTEGILAFDECVKTVTKGQKIKKAIGCFPGAMVNGKVFSTPNLPDYEGKLLIYELERIFGVVPHLENDADMAALGEAVYGAAKGFDIVAYITVSTGIGGGLIVDQKIQKKRYGFEPGHQIINYKTKETLHDLISGTALEKKYHKPAKEIKEPEIYDWISELLGVALMNTIIHWSPDVLVMGGSITKDIDLGDVEREIQKNLKVFPQIPVLKRTELGAYNGIWGALAMLQSEI